MDDPEHHRFVLRDNGAVAELVYRVEPERLVLVHTGVPEELGGRGIGGQLVRGAVGRVRPNRRATVVPQCDFGAQMAPRPSRRGGHGHDRLGLSTFPATIVAVTSLDSRRASTFASGTRRSTRSAGIPATTG